MHKYAMALPHQLIAMPEWRVALGRARLRRIEFGCDDADVSAENIGEKVRLLAQMQDAGEAEVGSVHIPFGGGWEFADPDESKRSRAAANTAAFIRACAPLHSPNFTLHGCLEPVPLAEPERAAWRAAFRRTLEELVPVAAAQGARLNVEDLPRSCLGNTAEELAAMVEGFPLETVGVCFDVNHLCGHPEKIASGIKLLAPRVHALHISDYDGVDECHWYPGLGVIDWAAVMAAVRELPNDALLIFECFGFIRAPQWQGRRVAPEVVLRSYERNAFYLENAAEIQRRIAAMPLD